MKYMLRSTFLFLMIVKTIHMHAQADECSSALELTNLNKYCSAAKQYTNANATPAANGLAIPGCFTTGSTADVWFKFTATATDVQLSVTGGGTNGTIKKPNIALYSGACAGTMFELACSTGNTDVTSLYKGSLSAGYTYFIRVSTTTANRGTFTFCISNFTPTVNPGADCDGVAQLCDTSRVIVPGLSGGGKNNKEIESSSCFYLPGDPNTLIEANSSWFKWTCDKAGKLTFDIIPVDPTNDLDFILYELNTANPCGARTIIRCSATSCVKGANGLNLTETDVNEAVNCNPPMGNGYVKYVDMIAGKTYALLVSNFSNASGFSIKFGGTATFLSAGQSVPVITAYDSATCAKNTITFSGSFSTKYKTMTWTFPSGIPSTAGTVGPHTVLFNTPGKFPIYLKTTDSACTSSSAIDSVIVTIYPLPAIDTTAMLISTSTNGNSDGSIKGISTNGTKYKWYRIPASLVYSSDTTTNLIDQPAGYYYLAVEDKNGCTDTSAVFEIKNEIPTTIDSKSKFPGLMLAPNPTSGRIELSFNAQEMTSVSIELSNVLGQIISKEWIKTSGDTLHYSFDLSNRKAGVYFVKISHESYSIVKKVIKQ